MKVKIQTRVFQYILLIMPFFKLYSIELFLDRNVMYSLFYPLDRILAVARWIITGYMMIDWIIRRRKTGIITKCIIIFAVIRSLSVYINGDLSLNILVGNISYIGAALLIERLLGAAENDFFKANIYYFGVLSFIGVFLNALLPNGFLGDISKEKAVYFLGSKNFGFYFYVPFMFFFILYYLKDNKKLPGYSLVFAFVLFMGAYFTDSANSMICLLILILYLACWQMISRGYHLLNPKFMIAALLIFEYIVLFGKDIPVIQATAELFGRSLTFTGRDYIWNYYIEQFLSSPVWGAGYDTSLEFYWGGGALHAHNFFLDNLTKYGVAEFVSIIITVIAAGRCVSKIKSRKIIVYCSVILFMLLLHSLFEDMSIYILALVFVVMEWLKIRTQEDRNCEKR